MLSRTLLSTRKLSWRSLAILVVALTLVAGACGDDDDADTTGAGGDTTAPAAEDRELVVLVRGLISLEYHDSLNGFLDDKLLKSSH